VVAFLFLKAYPKEGSMINKIQLNDAQVQLAKQWLPSDSHPYAYNRKLLWFRDSLGRKNAINLNQQMVDQLNQLS
jgi:hypothetical protein